MQLDSGPIYGVSINNVTGITGRRYGLPDLQAAGREAEAMGFGGVWVNDGMFGRRTTTSYDPVNLLTAIAARTSTLRLCTGILIPHIRNPVHFAQQWATLWEISEGRAVLGAGAGGGRGTIHKRQYGAIGGRAVVDHGEGRLTNHCHADELAGRWSSLAGAVETRPAGRTYTLALNRFVNVDDDPRRGRQNVKNHLEAFHGPPIPDDLVDRWAAAGPGKTVAERLNGFIDRGVSIFQFVVASPDQMGMMRRIANEVLPHLKQPVAVAR